ncbi:hypothetical protein HOT49_gp077 [Erwinia phage vB_EamM_Alexandra]|uniref:Uncharacterized protein n=1 Tax=Erwinia phage vB_EamM_Alexandra TaxID=2201424 RepID=A0A2Z4QE98_9CAUD|nr:hypothetical protein HOT49_gp077 [Erwinia phage vB_EamM_Alexandra]AWY08600.1 hypothetical protein Alexandra_77 [Erwinia phage vB_EamM_Alexandra]
MQYSLPARPGRTAWTDSPDFYTEQPMSNAALTMQDPIGISIGGGDFTIEAYFRVSDVTNPQNQYSTFLAFDRLNNDGDALDLMFTDTGFGAYVALVFSWDGQQQNSSNHPNTFTLQLTRTDFNSLTHMAFVRRSGTLTAYINGVPVKLRKQFNAYVDAVGNVSYVLNNIGPRRNTRKGNTGDISKVYTQTILTGLSARARYQGSFDVPVMNVGPQQRATVFM